MNVKKQLVKIFFTIILLFSVVAQAQASVRFPKLPELPTEDPNEIIHEIVITDENHIHSLLDEIKTKYPSVEITHKYKHVFPGFSLKGKRGVLQKIKSKPEVKQSSPVTTYKVSIDTSVPFIGGDDIRNHFDTKDHRLTGKGVKVGVIDTGVDYTHPDLRRNFRGGSDLVDGDNDPMETKGNSGHDTLHGTHVAGIIAANGKLKGVAPEAEIIGYRALGPGGMGTSEQVIAAIDRAIEDKVDVINLSLGNTINGPDWPTSLALDKASENGIVAVTSSGNSGPNVWTVGSPGTSQKAISVGASTPPIQVPSITVGFEDKQIPLHLLLGSIPWDLSKQYKIVEAGIGEETDFKTDVTNKIVLMERGKITFTEKALRAQEKGARAVIIYNNVSGVFEGGLDTKLDIPVAAISLKDGQWLKNHTTNPYVKTKIEYKEDLLANFSSRGPVTETWDIKPDVVAPGVAIESTIPNGYMELQGTSMAAPHVAGAAALIKQAHPDWTPEQIKAALMNTAHLLQKEDNTLYTPYEQGAGRIQLHEALHTESLVYPSSLPFGLMFHHNKRTKRSLTVTVENHSEETKKYSFDIPGIQEGIQWRLPTPFYLEPNSKKEIKISIDVTPSIIGPGLHHGYLYLHGESKSIHLPYMYVIEEPDYPRIMGFQFEKKQQKDTYVYEVYLPRGADEFGIALYDPDTFRFVGFLDWRRNVTRGLIRNELTIKNSKLNGLYKAIIFAKKAGKEDILETELLFDNTS